MSQDPGSKFSTLDYIIRPARKNERLAIAKLVLSENGVSYFWILAIFYFLYIISFALFICYFLLTVVLLPAWEYIKLSGLDFKFALSLIISVACWLVLPVSGLYFTWYIIGNKIDPQKNHVAVSNNHLIGAVCLIDQKNIAHLGHLFIKQEYRQKGIGTKLLRTAIATVDKPIYADYWTPDQKYFLNRFGFEQRKFGGLRFWLNKLSEMQQVVLSPTSRISTLDTQMNSAKQPREKYTIVKSDRRDLKDIYDLTASLQDTQDSFLPFGLNAIIRTSLANLFRLLLLPIVGVLIFGINLLVESDLFSNFPETKLLDILLLVAIALIPVIILFAVPQIIIKKVITDRLVQFWAIKYQAKTIGYGRISSLETYSILHHIYILPPFQAELMPVLLQRLIEQIPQPIYVACSRKQAKQYYEHGFSRVSIDRLPHKLQLRSKVGQKFGCLILRR